MKTFNRNKYLIPFFATIILGFVPMSIASIFEGTFFLSSDIPHPMLSITTIFAGDLLLLPIINTMVYAYFLKIMNWGWIWSRRSVLLMFIFSALINSLTHIYWLNDQYIEFIDSSSAPISFGGLFHYLFSIVQSVYLWIFISATFKMRHYYCKQIPIVYWALSLFFSLSFFDVWIKGIIRAEDVTLQYLVTNNTLPMILALTSAVLGFCFYTMRNVRSHSL